MVLLIVSPPPRLSLPSSLAVLLWKAQAQESEALRRQAEGQQGLLRTRSQVREATCSLMPFVLLVPVDSIDPELLFRNTEVCCSVGFLSAWFESDGDAVGHS